MFPDPTIDWQPFPSVIDGIEYPYVFHHGVRRGVVRLTVETPRPGEPGFGLEIVSEVHAAFDEMFYSIAGHGSVEGRYDGGAYIKEARSSGLLRTFSSRDPIGRRPRHFLFVGAESCHEVLSFSAPFIRTFTNSEDARIWGVSCHEEDDRTH